jgi:diguanylate cyclase (GGDEF)-like protein/PAS domain S-box-containing protein
VRRQVFNSHLIKMMSVDITHSGSPKKETTLQVHDFASRIQAIHKCIAKLYQNVHQLPLQSQKWLEESCEELHATVQELELTQEVLLQQNKELEIQLQECLKVKDCKQIRAVNHQLLSEIVERKRAEEALRTTEEQYRRIIETTSEGVWIIDAENKTVFANNRMAEMLGYTLEEILGVPLLKFMNEEWQAIAALSILHLRKGKRETFDFQLCRKDGSKLWVMVSANPILDQAGHYAGALGMFTDITERQIAQEKIHYQAMHDLLTGLPNRTLFNERLSMSLSKARNSQSLLAVMFLDLDRFKTINDTLGHAVGDRLLQNVAQRLSSCLRQEDTVARWGGDEFTLLVSETSSTEEVTKIAQHILDTLKPAFNLEEQTNTGHSTFLHISTSIGIALYPHNGEDAETLLRNADAALYCAKQQGRNNYQLYTAAMNSQACELLVLENQLHHALKREEFVVYYQPQVNITTGEITGMEALVRWQHPKCGLISPARFIPLAEETGLIVALDEWVLQTACAQNKAWQNAGLPALRVAVNLSARQFQQPSLLNLVAQTLHKTGLSPQFLELEITETIAMYDVDKTQAILSHLQQMGVYLSIDDFGTGYCSLGYLKQFPLHTLKIDKSFVRDIATEPRNAGIINAIMTLGKGFNLRVIAEGVETEAQRDCLRSFQCEEIQGYLSSPPLSTEEATQFLQNAYLINSKIY